MVGRCLQSLTTAHMIIEFDTIQNCWQAFMSVLHYKQYPDVDFVGRLMAKGIVTFAPNKIFYIFLQIPTNLYPQLYLWQINI